MFTYIQELARELVIQQPQDHVLFLREVLSNASHSRHAPRIVFIASPHVNTLDIAYLLADKCGATVVTEKDILNMLPNNKVHSYTKLLELFETSYTYSSMPPIDRRLKL